MGSGWTLNSSKELASTQTGRNILGSGLMANQRDKGSSNGPMVESTRGSGYRGDQ